MRLRFHYLLLCFAVLPFSGARCDGTPPALGFSGSGDVNVCRVFIPSDDRRHGEVRLVRRGEATSVQTLLYTPSLRRGVQKIRQEETAHWPPARTGHTDSQAYLGVLEQGKAAALAAFEQRENRGDPLQNLLIEVMQDGAHAWVSASLPEFSGAGDAVELLGARCVASSPVSVDYARAAMEIILQSAFHRPERTLEEFLSGDATRVDPATVEEANQPVTR